MHLPGRRRLLGALALLGSGSALAGEDIEAPARACLVPLDDFPEDLASVYAKVMQSQLGIRITSSLRLPRLDIPLLHSGMNGGQYAAGALLERAAKASARLPGLLPSTCRVFLTMRDINAESADFHFVFAQHNPDLNCSVVSMARLLDDGKQTDKALWRTFKLVKRAIGEMHLGWRRSTERRDLMYAPLMSVTDVDRLGLEHGLVDGEGARSGIGRLLHDAGDTMAAYGPRAWAFGPMLIVLLMCCVADPRPAELIGVWVVARPLGLVRALAAGALPFLAVLLLYVAGDLVASPWWQQGLFAAAVAASAGLAVAVFGTTVRYNDDALELRRLWRRPRIVPLAGARVEADADGCRFTVHGLGGDAIRLNVVYRPGAKPLVNYLTGMRMPASWSGEKVGDEASHRVQ
jgi:predicted Zn-dependent protease